MSRAARTRNPYREWIGAQIRGDAFGWAHPGNPRAAALLAYQYAALSHVGNGVYGEMWAAALVARAFTAEGPREALLTSLAHIPPESRLAEALGDVLDLHARDLSWERALVEIQERYGHYSWVHTINQAAVVAAGLLWGDGDYAVTVGLTVQAGWDTDSNGATAGSVAGVFLGRRGLPNHFVEPLAETSNSNKIRLADYADTPNPGGVYILAICSLDKGYPVTPSRCKYDAFKVQEAVAAKPLTVTKDAAGSYDSAYTWNVSKDVDKNLVQQVSGDATFTYTVGVTKSAPTYSNIKVTGTITVFNPNDVPVTGVDVTDQLSDGTNCTVTNGSNQTVVKGDNMFPYTCTLSSLPQGNLDNTVMANWSQQFLGDGSYLNDGSANFTFSKIVFAAHTTDDCVTVDDTFNGVSSSLGQVCATTVFDTYTHTVPVPPYGYTECASYGNTAKATADTTGATKTASQTVKVCGAIKTGARPMSYWKGLTGKGVITNSSTTGGVCNAATWLRQYAPFQDVAASATCAQLATYVTNTVKASTVAGSPMSARLKGNALATALNVYFSDTTLGGNQLASKTPVGNVAIDLDVVCQMTDMSTGAASCSGTYLDATSAFGGSSGMSVKQLLGSASAQSDPGGANWYGGDTTMQSRAKDTFSAINNKKAFRAL